MVLIMTPIENDSPEEIYKLMLDLLRNLGNPYELSRSRFVTTRLVQAKLEENSTLSPPEAVQEVFMDLLQTLRVGSEDRAELLYMRFWQGLKVEQIILHHNPKQCMERSILARQRSAILMLVGWFVERENALK